MATHPKPPPVLLVAQLRDDLNWWIDASAEEQDRPPVTGGILDPRQVAHLTNVLDQYRPHGFHPEMLTAAFQAYRIESELSEQRVRLARSDESLYHTAERLFALPLRAVEGDGPCDRLLEVVSAARIRFLNHSRHYAHDCTEEEMCAELDAVDGDRYFCDEEVHAFDEIAEILEWKPAEWDDSEL